MNDIVYGVWAFAAVTGTAAGAWIWYRLRTDNPRLWDPSQARVTLEPESATWGAW